MRYASRARTAYRYPSLSGAACSARVRRTLNFIPLFDSALVVLNKNILSDLATLRVSRIVDQASHLQWHHEHLRKSANNAVVSTRTGAHVISVGGLNITSPSLYCYFIPWCIQLAQLVLG